MQDDWKRNWTYHECNKCAKTQRMWLTEKGSLTCQVCGTVHTPLKVDRGSSSAEPVEKES